MLSNETASLFGEACTLLLTLSGRLELVLDRLSAAVDPVGLPLPVR
jgi:hypothetical protein